MAAPAVPLPGLLRVLSDPTRLRILALLEREELPVGELARSLALAQSRVSNHLRVLRETGLLAERHAGTSTFLRLPALGNGVAGFGRVWDALREDLSALPEHAADLVRLDGVLAARAGAGAAFFDRVAGGWDERAVAFETGQARQRAAAHLLPAGFVVADLGCGTGYMAAALLGQVAKLICVDASEGMLTAAKERLGRAPRGTEIELRPGALDALPIEDGELDGCVAGMVLHHLPSLDRPAAEMLRCLKPGGAAVVVELAPHREDWMRAELGDRHLGLQAADVVAALERAGFEDVVLDPVEDRYHPTSPAGERVSLPLYAVRGRKPRA
jgi:ArsR family transcriptional regulator